LQHWQYDTYENYFAVRDVTAGKMSTVSAWWSPKRQNPGMHETPKL